MKPSINNTQTVKKDRTRRKSAKIEIQDNLCFFE